MLGFAEKLAAGVETPASVGAHDPRLPAGTLVFQLLVERQLVAGFVAGRRRGFGKLFACGTRCRRFSAAANTARTEFATPFHAGAATRFSLLADVGEGSFTGGDLAGLISRRYG